MTMIKALPSGRAFSLSKKYIRQEHYVYHPPSDEGGGLACELGGRDNEALQKHADDGLKPHNQYHYSRY